MEANWLHVPHGLPSRLTSHPAAYPESWAVQLRWFATAAAVGFAVPFVGSSLLGLQHDVYLGIYFVSVLALWAAYAVSTQLTCAKRSAGTGSSVWRSASCSASRSFRNVFSEDATPRPDGAYYVFELIWRGGLYGATDALLLTVLPCLVVYRALGGHLASWRRRLAYFGASLALVMAITAVYHLGFAQYREDGVGAPETGNTIISMPMLLSTNPIGSIADHAAMHVSAVAHSYETEVRLPPPTKAR